MPRIHYFNPGHETEILVGTRSYTPPANVRKMQQDLAILPAWYAEEEDLVYAPDIIDPRFLSSLPGELHPFPSLVTKSAWDERACHPSCLQAMPWGVSPHSLHVFDLLRESSGIPISVPEWKEEYARLTSRQTAAECLEKIRIRLPDLPIPATPRFFETMQEIEAYMAVNEPPFVLKAPYSSSGRGLLWVPTREPGTNERNRINGALNKQGRISIEHGLDKVQDFALEFYSDGHGHIRYEGLSVFNTEERGAYTGNVVEAQATMRTRVTRFTGEDSFQRILTAVAQILGEMYDSLYTGYLGVDMLVYKQRDGTFAIHPCIEVNMRYTMGMVALRLFQHYIMPEATGDFQIAFEKKEGTAYERHLLMRDTYPLRFEKGKIREGYLSLCPVTKETYYRAYLLII